MSLLIISESFVIEKQDGEVFTQRRLINKMARKFCIGYRADCSLYRNFDQCSLNNQTKKHNVM